MDNLGHTIEITAPLWNPTGLQSNLTREIKSYSDVISAFGGYWSARFELILSKKGIEEWLATGLGRHVVSYDETGVCRWEGFVNQISATVGSLSFTIGPLVDIANRVQVFYSTLFVDPTTGETFTGSRSITAAANNDASQELYPVLHKVISGSSMEDAEALIARDMYLAERAWPQKTQRLSSGNAATLGVTVECLGYVHLLNYPVTITTTGSSSYSAKIAAAIALSPTGVGYDVSRMETNTQTVPALEENYSLGLNIIKGIVAMGGAGDRRWIFGIYDNRRILYGPAPVTIDYQHHLGNLGFRVESISGGGTLYPGSILPGRWLLIPDFLEGRVTPATLAMDPRAMFIESAQFTSPAGTELQGGTSSRLSQLLARLGLGGVSA